MTKCDRTVLVKWLTEQEHEYFLTLSTNRSSHHSRDICVIVRNFDAMLNRKLLGRSWVKYPSAERSQLVVIPEHNAIEGIHYHALLTLPPRMVRVFFDEEIESTIDRIWRKLECAGTVKLRRTATVDERFRAADYAVKRFYDSDGLGVDEWAIMPPPKKATTTTTAAGRKAA